MSDALGQPELVSALQSLGLAAGDSVVVHSSFKSLGPVRDGPSTVIHALLDTVGNDGNLVLPAFNYARPAPEPYFDPFTTPARTGILAETGRSWPGALRSLHPTHSVAVIGPEADALTRGHLDTRTVGVDSPLDRLARMGGKILLIGVGHTANTTIHIGEERAGLPKASRFDLLPVFKIKMPDGSLREHRLDTSPSCSAAFGAVEGALRRRDMVRDGRAGGALMQLMRGQDVMDTVIDLLRERPNSLLCTAPACRCCTETRRALNATGGWTGKEHEHRGSERVTP